MCAAWHFARRPISLKISRIWQKVFLIAHTSSRTSLNAYLCLLLLRWNKNVKERKVRKFNIAFFIAYGCDVTGCVKSHKFQCGSVIFWKPYKSYDKKPFKNFSSDFSYFSKFEKTNHVSHLSYHVISKINKKLALVSNLINLKFSKGFKIPLKMAFHQITVMMSQRHSCVFNFVENLFKYFIFGLFW